jgi:single-stranded DNA-binding protein
MSDALGAFENFPLASLQPSTALVFRIFTNQGGNTAPEQKEIHQMEINNVAVRLTAEPDELRTTPSGKQVVSFNVAYNWRTRTDAGFKDVETTFFRCTLWGEDGAAEFAELGLRKGDRLRACGRWAKNPWVAKDGKTRIDINLTVTAVSLSHSTETEISPAESPAEEAPPAEPAKSPAKRRRSAA